jgi:signal transduction histidine kinase
MAIDEVTDPMPAAGVTPAPHRSRRGAIASLFGSIDSALVSASGRVNRSILASRLHGRQRTIFAVAMALSVLLIVGFNDALGNNTSASADVLYMVPLVLATIAVGRSFGTIIALETAVAWVLSDALVPPPETVAAVIWNGVLRLVVLSSVVVLLGALLDALAEARSSDRRSKEFLSYAAHQVRTPIAGMRTCAESLIISGVSEEQERLLGHLVSESRRIGRMVGSMLQLARLDQGEVFEASPTDVTRLCRAQVDLARQRTTRLIEISLRVQSAPTERVLLGSEAIQEALANLLDNAARHAKSRVEVSISVSGHDVQIEVTDDGPGLPKGSEQRAFERFVSMDGKGGAGMGLPIARALVEGEGGQLGLARGGFVMRLPLDRRERSDTMKSWPT